MSVTFDIPIYGITGAGKKIQIGTGHKTIATAQRVGGKIFYINSTSSGGTYTFYDSEGEILTDIAVGDTPYAYSVTGTPDKDKYYVTRSSAVTSKTWTYKQNDSWVYTLLGTATAIGTGKTNTATVVAADTGAYVNYAGTIWNSLKTLNDNVTDGCNDWFVPSKEELEALRNARDRDGNALTTLFSNTYIWSSSEYNATHAWLWYYGSQNWDYSNKHSSNALLAARAF